MQKTNVAILGATGMVGQRFIQLLHDHPYFTITHLLASDRSSDKPYKDACKWLIGRTMPQFVQDITVEDANKFISQKDGDVDIVFSALPSDTAKELEALYAEKGYKVFSNASAFRMEEDVPLVVTEINAEHHKLVKTQQKDRGWKGFIVTNPNCSTIIMSLALKPLYDAFGIESVIVTTLQAVSGAGYPGVASLDIVDNVLPFISKEEEKMETETLKILGSDTTPAKFHISATCQRVCTLDGHLENLYISLKNPASLAEVSEVLYNFNPLSNMALPTAPETPIIITDDPMRPQPRLDRDTGGGMAITVGRIRPDSVLPNGVKMTILGHNTIRGAAGQSVLNAEWWVKHFYAKRIF